MINDRPSFNDPVTLILKAANGEVKGTLVV